MKGVMGDEGPRRTIENSRPPTFLLQCSGIDDLGHSPSHATRDALTTTSTRYITHLVVLHISASPVFNQRISLSSPLSLRLSHRSSPPFVPKHAHHAAPTLIYKPMPGPSKAPSRGKAIPAKTNGKGTAKGAAAPKGSSSSAQNLPQTQPARPPATTSRSNRVLSKSDRALQLGETLTHISSTLNLTTLFLEEERQEKEAARKKKQRNAEDREVVSKRRARERDEDENEECECRLIVANVLTLIILDLHTGPTPTARKKVNRSAHYDEQEPAQNVSLCYLIILCAYSLQYLHLAASQPCPSSKRPPSPSESKSHCTRGK